VVADVVADVADVVVDVVLVEFGAVDVPVVNSEILLEMVFSSMSMSIPMKNNWDYKMRTKTMTTMKRTTTMMSTLTSKMMMMMLLLIRKKKACYAFVSLWKQ